MVPETQIPGFEWVDGIRQISGFKALSDAVTAPVSDCSGAMHQASISHVMAWNKQFNRSWEDYIAYMREHKDD